MSYGKSIEVLDTYSNLVNLYSSVYKASEDLAVSKSLNNISENYKLLLA